MPCGARIATAYAMSVSTDDEETPCLHLHVLAEAALAAVEREHILREHRRQREDLRIARHDGRHDAGAENARQPQRRVALEHDRHHVVAGRLPAERGTILGGHRRRRCRQALARLEFGSQSAERRVMLFAATPRNTHGSQIARMHSG